MNYIVLDLEWNSSDGTNQNSDLANEIIEIGAVKLNDDFETVGYFDRYIKPVVYPELSHHIRNVITIDESRLICARSFKIEFQEFICWCGEDYIFCTWGEVDLKVLQRNVFYHNLENPFPFPFKYYDIQSIFSKDIGESRTFTLNYAILFFKIKAGDEFHTAIFDAKYTAAVMKKLDMKSKLREFSVDLYRIPENREQEFSIEKEGNVQFFSMRYFDRGELFADGRLFDFFCPVCKKPLKGTCAWQKNFKKSATKLGICKEHGKVYSKVNVKSHEDGGVHAVRITSLIDDARYDELLEKINKKNEV